MTVMNLATGQKIEYGDIPAQKAVVCAFEQYTKKNWQTWDYKFDQAKQSKSGLTWVCGDWASLKEHKNK